MPKLGPSADPHELYIPRTFLTRSSLSIIPHWPTHQPLPICCKMSSYPDEPPAAYHANNGSAPHYDAEKGFSEEKRPSVIEPQPEYDVQERSGHELHRSLKSRHMQMIAIGMHTMTEVLGT